MPAKRKPAPVAPEADTDEPYFEKKLPYDGEHCIWPAVTVNKRTMPKCTDYDGPTYLGRHLCSEHHALVMGWEKNGTGFPRQLMLEILAFELIEEDLVEYGKMTFAEREAKVKGQPCSGCKRNVPDAKSDSIKVWCWKCVMEGKHRSAERSAHIERVLSERAAVKRAPKREGFGSITELKLSELAEGKMTLTWEGNKGPNVFTGGGPGQVKVSDHKGITTYELNNDDHKRIVLNRLQRWYRKSEPSKTAEGRTALKGPKCEVRIKGAGEE